MGCVVRVQRRETPNLFGKYQWSDFLLWWEAEMGVCALCLDPTSSHSHGLISFPKWLKPFEVNPLASVTARGLTFDTAYSFYGSQHPHFVPFGLAIFKSHSASSKWPLAILWAKLAHDERQISHGLLHSAIYASLERHCLFLWVL